MKHHQNHYKLIELVPKKRIVKVYNFKKNQTEVYSLSFVKPKSFNKEKSTAVFKNKPNVLVKTKEDFAFEVLFSLYKKYKGYLFLSQNDYFFKYIYFKFVRKYGSVWKKGKESIFQQFYDYKLKKALSKQQQCFSSVENNSASVVSVYVTLRRTNIFVTITENNKKVKKIFSSGCIGVERSDRKRSPSFFMVVKRTLRYLKPYVRASRKKFVFKLIFKGFKRFRRPLINRFFFNKGFKSKCIGIINLDFEPFNGCRKRKAKRLKLKKRR